MIAASRRPGPTLIDDPRVKQALAPVGSEQWAEYCRKKLAEAIDREQRGLMEFSAEFELFLQHQGWRVLRDADGEPFADFRAFALAKRPHGLGCTDARLKLLLGAIRKSARERGKARALNPNGTNQHSGDGGLDISNPSSQGGTSADYWAARLRRDAPEFADALAAGKYRTVRAACRAAGLIAPVDPVAEALKWVRKMDRAQRERFEAALRDVEAP